MESPKKRGRPKKEEVSEKVKARRRQRSAKRKGVSKPVGRPTQTQNVRQSVVVKIESKKATRKASGKSSGTPPASYKHNLAPIFIQPSPQPDYTELFKALQNNRSIPMETIAENTPLSTSVSQGIQTSNPLSIGVSQAIQTSSPLSVKSEPARVKPSFVPNNFIPNDFLGRRLEDDEISELSMDESGITMDEPAFSVKSEPIPIKTPPPLRSGESEPKPKPSKRLPLTKKEFPESQSPLEPLGNSTGSIKGDDNSLDDKSKSFKSASSIASSSSSSMDSVFKKDRAEEESATSTIASRIGEKQLDEIILSLDDPSKDKIRKKEIQATFDKLASGDKPKLHQLNTDDLYLIIREDEGNVKRQDKLKKYYITNPSKKTTQSYKDYQQMLDLKSKGLLDKKNLPDTRVKSGPKKGELRPISARELLNRADELKKPPPKKSPPKKSKEQMDAEKSGQLFV